MKKSILVAVDVGATNIKMLAAGFDGRKITILDKLQMADKTIVKNGHEYIDLDEIFSNIKKGLYRFKDCGNLVSLGIDTYGNGYGILDDNGKLLGAPHFYRDRRIDGIKRFVNRYYTDRQMYESTGNFPIKTRGLFHLCQDVLENSPGIQKGKYFLPLSNLLEYGITGEIGAERTIASVLYLLDHGGNDWNFELFHTFGIPKELFGNITDPGENKGKITKIFSGMENFRDITVAGVAGHDTESALLAAPFLTDEMAFISLGTSFIFGARVDSPVINEKSYEKKFKNIRSAFGFYSLCRDFPGFWIMERCMEIWRREIPEIDYTYVQEAVRGCKNQSIYIDISDDRFRVSENNIIETISSYCKETGQKSPNGISDMAAALFGSYAMYLKRCLQDLEEITGTVYKGLVAVNGGVQNKLLMQMFADTLGIPVIAGSPYASALGNLLLQLYTRQEITSVQDLEEVSRNSTEPLVYRNRVEFNSMKSQALQ